MRGSAEPVGRPDLPDLPHLPYPPYLPFSAVLLRVGICPDGHGGRRRRRGADTSYGATACHSIMDSTVVRS